MLEKMVALVEGGDLVAAITSKAVYRLHLPQGGKARWKRVALPLPDFSFANRTARLGDGRVFVLACRAEKSQ